MSVVEIGAGDVASFQKTPGVTMCLPGAVYSAEAELALIATGLKRLRNSGGLQEELGKIAEEFAIEAESLARQRKGGIKDHLGKVAEEFATEAERLATQRLAKKLKAAMVSFGLSVTRKSEEELGMIADEFKAEAMKLTHNRKTVPGEIACDTNVSEIGERSADILAIVAAEFAEEARKLVDNRQEAKVSDQLRYDSGPIRCFEEVSQKPLVTTARDILKRVSNACRRQRRTRVVPFTAVDDNDGNHAPVSLERNQQIALLFRDNTSTGGDTDREQFGLKSEGSVRRLRRKLNSLKKWIVRHVQSGK